MGTRKWPSENRIRGKRNRRESQQNRAAASRAPVRLMNAPPRKRPAARHERQRPRDPQPARPVLEDVNPRRQPNQLKAESQPNAEPAIARSRKRRRVMLLPRHLTNERKPNERAAANRPRSSRCHRPWEPNEFKNCWPPVDSAVVVSAKR